MVWALNVTEKSLQQRGSESCTYVCREYGAVNRSMKFAYAAKWYKGSMQAGCRRGPLRGCQAIEGLVYWRKVEVDAALGDGLGRMHSLGGICKTYVRAASGGQARHTCANNF